MVTGLRKLSPLITFNYERFINLFGEIWYDAIKTCVLLFTYDLFLLLSLMQACCDVAFDYAHTREQFNQKIGTFQVNNNERKNH